MPLSCLFPGGTAGFAVASSQQSRQTVLKNDSKASASCKVIQGQATAENENALESRVYGSLPFNDVQRWVEVTSDSSKDEAIDSQEIDSDETQRAILCFLHASSPWTVRRFAR